MRYWSGSTNIYRYKPNFLRPFYLCGMTEGSIQVVLDKPTPTPTPCPASAGLQARRRSTQHCPVSI